MSKVRERRIRAMLDKEARARELQGKIKCPRDRFIDGKSIFRNRPDSRDVRRAQKPYLLALDRAEPRVPLPGFL